MATDKEVEEERQRRARDSVGQIANRVVEEEEEERGYRRAKVDGRRCKRTIVKALWQSEARLNTPKARDI